jgi:hypothetical protein
MHGNRRDLNYDLLPLTSASVCLMTYTGTLKRHLRKINLFSSSPNSPVQTHYSLRTKGEIFIFNTQSVSDVVHHEFTFTSTQREVIFVLVPLVEYK